MVGGAISDGRSRFILHIETPRDLNRELIKSNFSSVQIPELSITLSTRTLGDCALLEAHQGLLRTLEELNTCYTGKRTFTLIFDNPLSNSTK
jgi:C4-type Zn-finger protein